jgi:hypothetical protein
MDIYQNLVRKEGINIDFTVGKCVNLRDYEEDDQQ